MVLFVSNRIGRCKITLSNINKKLKVVNEPSFNIVATNRNRVNKHGKYVITA